MSPLPASVAEEKRVVTACLDSSTKKSHSFALQQQQPMCGRTCHSSGARVTSGESSNSSGSSSMTDNTNESACGAMEGEATAGPLNREDASVRRAALFSRCSAARTQACVSNTQQKGTSGSRSSSTAARKEKYRRKPIDPLPSAPPSSSPSSQAVRGGLSSSRRSTSATMMAESAKHSLVCSLLMPDGVTVRKPPPLGIASGDPVGTHILRKRATSMRTENFSSSGLNLSLHRRAAGNNSMLSWQRSFRSTPRGAAFSSCFPFPASGSFSYNRRARGGSFMGRPIETLPRLMAFSPSLSKALNQQVHLIPAPPRVDSEEAGPATVDAAAVSTEDAASPAAAAADAAPRPAAAAGASPDALAATPEVGSASSAGTWAQAGFLQDKEAERTSEATDFTRNLRAQAPLAGSCSVTAAAQEEAKRVGDTRGADSDVVHVDETLTASHCIDSTPSRVSFSSAVDSSSSVSLVRRRARCSTGEVLKTNQGTSIELDHPTCILSDTTVAAGSSGSSSSRSESSSSEGNHVSRSKDDRTSSDTSSIRSPTCWPPMNEHASRDLLPGGVRLSLPSPEDAAAVEGAGAHATSCAQEEAQGEQQHEPPVSPAQLYQLGIIKFTEGKTPEAIEAITNFLRDAVARKRHQRTTEGSTAKQPCALSVSTIENSGGQRGGREEVRLSSLPAGGNLSTTAIEAATVEKQHTDKKNEMSPLPRVSSAEDIARERAKMKTVIPKGQDASSFASSSDTLSPPSSPPDLAAVSTDEPVLSEAVASAAVGETPGAAPLEKAEVWRVATEKTEQQQEREKAQLQMQSDQQPEENKAGEADQGTAQKTNAREGEPVTREEEQLSPVILQSAAAASRTSCPGLQLEGDRTDLQEKLICEGFTVEKDSYSQIDSATNVTLITDGTSSRRAATHAAAAETTAAVAISASLSGALGGTAPDETKKQQTYSSADRAKEAAPTSFSPISSLDQLEPVAEGDGHLKERIDGDGKATADDNRGPAIFKSQEPVPIQKLYGVVLGRRMQIDRRAKDLIAGWGAPQYLQLEKLLGHLLFEEADYPEAIRHYWRCIDLRPDDSQLYTNLGLAYFEMGATEEATASFEQALKYNDRNTVALSVLAMLLMDEFELAEEELTQKEADNAGEGEFTCDETLRMKRLREGTDRCVTLLKRCVEAEGDNMLSVLHLAQVYMYREEWDEAEAIFKALLHDNSDDTHLLNNLGQIAMNKGATQEALQLFERVLQINPQDEVAHMHMCEALCTLQHLGRALQHFCLCCEASPDSVSLHATCGLPLCEAGKEKEVVAAYTNFIKQHPESVAAKTFKRSLGSAGDQVGFLESSQIIMFIVLPILLLIVVLVGFTHLISYWSSPADDRELPPSWESIYYASPPDESA